MRFYCYISNLLKCNISKKTSYITGNKKITGKTCVLNLRNKLMFSFLQFKVVDKQTMNLFACGEDFGLSNFIGWIEKYEPALSESDSFWE